MKRILFSTVLLASVFFVSNKINCMQQADIAHIDQPFQKEKIIYARYDRMRVLINCY
jgi:hypothetical protein